MRGFLLQRFGREGPRLDELCPQDVNRFILHWARSVRRSYAKLMVTALRSFLRFLQQRGEITADLAAAVPTVANWRLSHLPKALAPEQVERLLACCDRSTRIGQRDYAILLLLARLGLRAGEVVAMTLDDLDWQAGEFVVHGEGSRLERMPLPQELGAAPANSKPLEWMLLTTIEVNSFEQALQKIAWYTKRWGIEVYHRTLKSGCKIETRQLGSAERIEACLAIDIVVAWPSCT